MELKEQKENIKKSFDIPVNNSNDFTVESLQLVIKDIDHLLEKAKRNNVIYHLNEMKVKINKLLESAILREKELEEKEKKVETEDNQDGEKNDKQPISIKLVNKVLLTKYILNVKTNTVNISFDLPNVHLIEKDDIYFKCIYPALFLIVKQLDSKDYFFLVNNLKHEVDNETSYYKISENTITIVLTKKNKQDKWEELEEKHVGESRKEIGPNDTIISIPQLKNIYMIGTEKEKANIRNKFGDDFIDRILSGEYDNAA